MYIPTQMHTSHKYYCILANMSTFLYIHIYHDAYLPNISLHTSQLLFHIHKQQPYYILAIYNLYCIYYLYISYAL